MRIIPEIFHKNLLGLMPSPATIFGETMSEYSFAAATEEELNAIVEGKPPPNSMVWKGQGSSIRMSHGVTGVIWKEARHPGDVIRPMVLIFQSADHRRLFGRFSQLHSDLSPLSTWCHIIAPSRIESIEMFTRDAELGGYEAAWAGLVVAEALLLANLPISKIKIAACLTTQSFAIGRSKAMWSPVANADVMDRYDRAQLLFRAGEQRASRLRPALEPIWSILSIASVDEGLAANGELRPLVDAVRSLNRSRLAGDVEAESMSFAQSLAPVAAEAAMLYRLPSLTPEQRVREFDQLLSALSQLPTTGAALYRQALMMLAGYLATVVAGGSPSLALVEEHARRWPEVMAWAYVLGSVGERVSWTSGFDGLGRLVARELMRSLRLDEPPTCDFSLDEAQILYDPALADPLVYLKLKQSRVATVALYTGVNIAFPIGEQKAQEPRLNPEESDLNSNANRDRSRVRNDAWEVVADAVWPYIRNRISMQQANDRSNEYGSRSYAKNRTNKRPVSQTKLPLKSPREDD
jgi:hypothetical protein